MSADQSTSPTNLYGGGPPARCMYAGCAQPATFRGWCPSHEIMYADRCREMDEQAEREREGYS